VTTAPAAAIPAGLTPGRAKVLEVALSQVGTREASGKNDGPVEKYMPEWARGKGLPYCAWFTSWCFREALGQYPYDRHIGAVSGLYEAGKALDEALDLNAEWPALTPQPGDIFIVLHGDYVPGRSTPGHAGIVLRVDDGARMINTVEGNYRNRVGMARRSYDGLASVLNPYGRLCGEHSSVGWERGLIDGLPLAGGLIATR
jgi:hypothetical protein